MERLTQNNNREIELFVPGRLCLFGEHSDWAGKYVSQNPEILEGQAIVTGINLGIYATAPKPCANTPWRTTFSATAVELPRTWRKTTTSTAFPSK